MRKKAKEVPKKDLGSRKLKSLLTRMKKLLKKEELGVAIAAPQVGESLRIFVIAGKVFESSSRQEPPHSSENGLAERSEKNREPFREGEAANVPHDRVFVNPEITRHSRRKLEMSEGCLSIPGKYGTVLRHERVSLKALDEQGRSVSHNAIGLLAHIFQHECDHLDGILYTDKTIKLEEDENIGSAREKLKEKHNI